MANERSAHPNQPPPGVTLPGTREESVSVLRRRWRKFRTLKRGGWSFLVLVGLFAVSLFNPLLINNRALVVKHEGKFYFPALAEWTTGSLHKARDLGQRAIGEADYRKLKEQYAKEGKGDWVLLPPYPYHPNESLLDDPALEGPP